MGRFSLDLSVSVQLDQQSIEFKISGEKQTQREEIQ